MLVKIAPVLVVAVLGAAQQSFHITPLRRVPELRAEALAAKPPQENGSFRSPDLIDVSKLDSRIKLEIRYATTDNFMGAAFYSSARAFLQRPAAEALLRAHRELLKHGYGLLIFDAYRPWYVTKMFWEGTPAAQHRFVADPAQGSRHNRGCAVDLTLYELRTGREAHMTGGYDEMSDRSYANYSGGTPDQRARRDLLRHAMERQGFTVNEYEWWHFDYKDWSRYPILNVGFEKLS
jgi:zinc D-Ala-D-Ala dipeptidase